MTVYLYALIKIAVVAGVLTTTHLLQSQRAGIFQSAKIMQ